MLAIVFTVVLALLGAFQVALACGAPYGQFVWGGQHPGVLPTRYRIGSGLSVLLYAVFALLALDRAGEIDVVSDSVARTGMWILFGYLALGVLMNAASRSKPERFTMTPVTIVLATLAFLVATG